jgi:hypothetical protein
MYSALGRPDEIACTMAGVVVSAGVGAEAKALAADPRILASFSELNIVG